MMATKKVSTLPVPGAELYYEVRGAGPVVLMIAGGMGDCGAFGPVGGLLAEQYTVLTYDRRGNSRSPIVGPVEDMKMVEQSDDARLLLDEIGAEEAYVFGSSSGAIIALDLLIRYPQRVAGLVAHEPPLLTLLPDGDEQVAFFDELDRIRVKYGVPAAMVAFADRMMPDMEQAEFEPGLDWDPEMGERSAPNAEFWFVRETMPTVLYQPDRVALAAVADRLVLGVGELSRGRPAGEAGQLLADSVGSRVVEFAGGHVGYLTRPHTFFEQFQAVLAELSAKI
jgi:pimeloyl-ACP methyl ester carboxylesterase